MRRPGSEDFLDMYDEPVRRFIEENMSAIGYDPADFTPVIDVVIEESKNLVRREDLHLPPGLMLSRIEEQALVFIRGILAQSWKFRGIHDRIRSYGSVFLVGAGTSFESGIPLTNVLDDLVSFSGASDYEDLRKDRDKCFKFKEAFKAVCDKKKPSVSHKLIALNFPEHIREVICLNWDNLIERSAAALQRREMRKVNVDEPVSDRNYVWKFHGDVDIIRRDNLKGKGGWVLPFEEGHVFSCFLDYVKESGLDNSMFTFIITGYSEREKEIYNMVIDCFEKKPPRPTFRIGLDLSRLHQENYLLGPCDYVLQKILPICP